MSAHNDPLLTLTRIAEGAIHIVVNEHTTGYGTVADEISPTSLTISPYQQRYAVIEEKLRESMIKHNTMVEVSVVVDRSKGESIRTYGVKVEDAVQRTLERIWKLDPSKRTVVPLPVGVNYTELLQKLADHCKASVHFEMNEFKGKYWSVANQAYTLGATAKDFFADLEIMEPDEFEEDDDGDVNISPAERKAMEDLDQTLRIQFYPYTPVGSYAWYDTDIGDMLERAVDIVTQPNKY